MANKKSDNENVKDEIVQPEAEEVKETAEKEGKPAGKKAAKKKKAPKKKDSIDVDFDDGEARGDYDVIDDEDDSDGDGFDDETVVVEISKSGVKKKTGKYAGKTKAERVKMLINHWQKAG